MRTVSATEAKQGLAGLLDLAAQEPIVIRRQKRNIAVVMSIKEYERLTQHNITEFQRFCDAVGDKASQAGLTEDKLAELLVDD